MFIDPSTSYWRGAFLIMLTISWTDVAYTVGNLQISISFDARSQGLAGGIFNVATRLGTSLALALSSSIANAVSASYRARHPELGGDMDGEKEVLMAGFRAGGWVSVGLAGAALAVCVFGIRGVGVIGAKGHLGEDAAVVPVEGGVEEKKKLEKLGDVESGARSTLVRREQEKELWKTLCEANIFDRIPMGADAPKRTSVVISSETSGPRTSIHVVARASVEVSAGRGSV